MSAAQRLLPPMVSSREFDHNRIAVIRAPMFESTL
ncbi:hypothetical protein M2375_000773 [Comamonas sp. BIGb0152]|nr:hypothetical protein [Comamonas sp. BIGb0152]